MVHDYLKEYGGAERVLEELHNIFPEAPIFTSVYLPEYLGPHKKKFQAMKIHASWANRLPMRHKLISPLRLISPLLFRSFNFSGYDVIISSATGAYFPNTLKKKKAKLICYCHTPPRYLYGYATAREWKNNVILNIVGSVINHFLRMVDFKASESVDQYIANSQEVAARIKKFYKKEVVVVYPPVVKQKKDILWDKESYFITGGRLARAKHNEIAIKACQELGVPLKVFGKGFAGYEDELKELAKGKGEITFVGEVTDEEKWRLFAQAKAFLYASEDEDFGIIPVEAMAAGTPVIAYRSGGVKETIIEGKTGVFYDELTTEGMKEAIQQFEKLKLRKDDCQKRADTFSVPHFTKRIKEIIAA